MCLTACWKSKNYQLCMFACNLPSNVLIDVNQSLLFYRHSIRDYRTCLEEKSEVPRWQNGRSTLSASLSMNASQIILL